MSEWPKNFNKSKAITFIVNYKPQIKIDPSDVYYEPQVPKALFFSANSFELQGSTELTNPCCFFVIKPLINRWSYNYLDDWNQEQKNPFWNIFSVMLEWNQDIVLIKGQDIGEGMAKAREIILSNGDSPEWTRLDFETFSNEGKIIKSFIDVSIGKSSRVFDFQRKCWFLETDVVKPLLEGFKTLIAQGTLRGYTISDNRETIEAFEDFFNKGTEGLQATPPKAKAALKADFITICAQGQVKVDAGVLDLDKVDYIKPYYRKAALALHPDRNNGDGSKMSELNSIWNQLQQYL